MSYAKATKQASPISISKQTVMNKVHALEHIPHTLIKPTKPNLVDELFIKVNEDHVAMQDSTNKTGFTSYAQQQLKEALERKQSIKKAIIYIRNQGDAVRVILLDQNILSSTEAYVRHILSARLSSRPMRCSKKRRKYC